MDFDGFLASFPNLLRDVLEHKRLEQKRSDIARLSIALMHHCNTTGQAVNEACEMYKLIEENTK